jgi:hypothetical protein
MRLLVESITGGKTEGKVDSIAKQFMEKAEWKPSGGGHITRIHKMARK